MNRVLLLNSENEPLRICTWKRALKLLINGKAQCAKSIQNIEDYLSIDNTQIPRVIRLNYNVAVP
ncbi:HNH endonuclease, partial [bacterium]|nr:HNH endonuclease [bacterium]